MVCHICGEINFTLKNRLLYTIEFFLKKTLESDKIVKTKIN